MKKLNLYFYLAFIVFVFLYFSPLYSQQIPNSSFETFKANAHAGYEPEGWYGSNVSQMGVDGIFVTQESGGRTGNCVKMKNQWVGALGIGSNAPAYISLGTPWSYINGTNINSASGGTDGGISFTFRPDTLVVWIKRSYSSAEIAHALVYLWSGTTYGDQYKNSGGGCSSTSHTDEESDVRGKNTCRTTQTATLIGEGEWKSAQQFNSWTRIAAPITYYNNNKPEKINIIISSADYPNGRDASKVKEGSTLWADDMSLSYSSQISEIRLDGTVLRGFSKDIYTQDITLGLGVTSIPTITCYRNGRILSSSEINITYGTVDGESTTITVTAEDKSSQSTYTLNFFSTRSTNPRPTSIEIDGTPINNFSGYIYNYDVQLNYGATTCPNISVTKAEEGQTYTITECNTLPGTATVTMYAEDKSISQIYNINFTVAALSDNSLSGILIKGVPIPNFSPTKTTYTVELPVGTTTIPLIEPVSNYPSGAQTIIATDNGLDGTYKITVSTPGNPTPRVYNLNFKIIASQNSLLNNLLIDGTAIPNFDPDVTLYNYTLPQKTTTLPEITWVLGDAYQTVSIEKGDVNGITKITVTSQSGNSTTYRIRFSVFKSPMSTLNDIRINEKSIESFSPEQLIYNYQLPSGTTSLPTIEYTIPDNANSTVKIVTNGVNDYTYLHVTAEDGIHETTYKIAFSVLKSTDAELTSISVGGATLPNFNSKELNYTYVLTEGTETLPNIKVETKTAGQQVEITAPKLTGTAYIKVYSESGDSYNIYTINFSFKQSGNCNLADILVDNVSLAGFDSLKTEYTVNLATETMPEITYITADTTATVSVVKGSLSDKYTINVTAENGTSKNYQITFDVAPSNNALLKDIQLFNQATGKFVSIDNFSPNIFAYYDTLEWRTKEVPVIRPIKGQAGQIVTISYGKINAKTIIHVVSENGTTQDYTIDFYVKKSSLSVLGSLTVANAILNPAFDPNIFEYSVTLPYGTSKVPTITWTKGETSGVTVTEQKIELISKSLRDTTLLTVVAENGNKNVYRLNFEVTHSDKANVLNSLILEGYGNILTNNDSVFDITLPYGTTDMPTISYTKNYDEQTVLVTNGGIYSPTIIKIKPNKADATDKTYIINPKVEKLPVAHLTDIKVNGVSIDGFKADRFNYIVAVTDIPTVEFIPANGADNPTMLINNNKQIKAEVAATNPDDPNTTIYELFFYYKNDTIPNYSFENWSTTKYNNAQKPTSWMAPADAVEKYQFAFFGTYTSGVESAPITETELGSNPLIDKNTVARLKTTYHRWSISGSFPGMITLGEITGNLTSAGGSTSSVSGGISFRNTPDTVLMNYRPEATENIDKMKFTYTLADENANSITKEFYGVYKNNLGTWKTMSLPIYDPSIANPTTMNIIINSADSENANTYGGVTAYESTLYVDNVRFAYNSKIATLKVNETNAALNGTNATITIDSESEGIPTLTITGEVNDQAHILNWGNETTVGENKIRTATIQSIAEDGSNSNYILTVTRPKSSNTDLKNILVNGTAIEGFNTGTTLYNLSKANGYRFIKDIQAQKGNCNQQISFTINNTNDTLLINVTAENGDEKTYTLTFAEEKSNNATLQNLTIENNDIEYSTSNFAYNVTLAANASEIPTLLFDKQSDGQTVIMQESGTNGDTKITVIAEDGTTTNTYNITFVTAEETTSALMNDISIDNITLTGFDAETYDYTYEKESSEIDLTYKKSFVADSMATILYSDSVLWNITNGTQNNRYKLTFTNAVSSNTSLSGININGNLIAEFSEDKTSYSINIDADTIPVLTVTKGDDNQTVNISTITTGENVCFEITVTAENGLNKQTYKVEIVSTMPKSNDATLANIMLDETQLIGFDKNTFIYTFELPSETETLPTLSALKNHDKQTITIETNGVKDTTLITVIAEDKTTKNIYKVAFSVKKSQNDKLNSIMLGNIKEELSTTGKYRSNNDFTPAVLNYEIILPVGSTEIPAIDWVLGQKSQTVTKIIDNDLNISQKDYEADVQIKVVAEDNLYQKTYTLHFTVEKSNNAQLASIFANDQILNDFDADKLNYQITLPYGTNDVPVITCSTFYDMATAEITAATSLSDTTRIVVTAEDCTTVKEYEVYFKVLPSDNALLNNIFIGGEPLTENANGFSSNINFNSETFIYEISLPYGTNTLPAITWEKQVADYDTIYFTKQSEFPGTSSITVVSQDKQNTNSYELAFSIKKSNNAKLQSLSVQGILLNDFQSDNYYYEIAFPYGTATSKLPTKDDIVFVKSEDEQRVNITSEEITTDEYGQESVLVYVNVTAQNGIDKNYYVIKSYIELSEENRLKMISINGKELPNFDPDVHEYTYLLPYGISKVPDKDEFKFTRFNNDQETLITFGNINETTIISVFSQKDIKGKAIKASGIYQIKFVNTLENPGDDPTSDDVCWTALGNGRWKASTDKNNVYIYIFDIMGRLINKKSIPTIDPNDNLCSPTSDGVVFQFEKRGQAYVYLFVGKNKRIKQGKFLY